MRYSQLTQQLNENLGNLAQLNLGPLINVLKQSTVVHASNSFENSKIGSTSTIIDVGVIKHGLKDIRKAYRTYASDNLNHYEGEIVAFAVYINNSAVAFGDYDIYNLRTRNDSSRFAYDLSKFSDILDAYHAKETHNTRVADTSATDKLVGSFSSVSDMAKVIELIDVISKEINGAVSLKLVTRDAVAYKKRVSRMNNEPLDRFALKAGLDTLKQRLVKFKNSKMLTVDTIQDFIAAVMSKAAKVVNFAGTPYHTVSNDTYHKSTPQELMSGKAFSITYKDANKDKYAVDGLRILYKFDSTTMLIVPIQAEYVTATGKIIVVLEPTHWLKNKLGVKNIDKSTFIGTMLKSIKDKPNKYNYVDIKQVIGALRDAGYNWNELDIIEHTIDIELAKLD